MSNTNDNEGGARPIPTEGPKEVNESRQDGGHAETPIRKDGGGGKQLERPKTGGDKPKK